MTERVRAGEVDHIRICFRGVWQGGQGSRGGHGAARDFQELSAIDGFLFVHDIENEKAQAELQLLKAQINPHFLFNSLNSIKSLVIENPNVARRAIDLLSDLLRSSLYEKDKDLIYIKNELSLVYDYIELEKMRFEERLQLKTNIDDEVINYKIPTLSIQLLVENAIKHNIVSKSKHLTIDIYFDNQFIVVSNNLQKKKNNQIALHQLLDRSSHKACCSL